MTFQGQRNLGIYIDEIQDYPTQTMRSTAQVAIQSNQTYSVYGENGHRWTPVWQRYWRGDDAAYFNFALDDADLPQPRVNEEIFIYSPGMEEPLRFVVRELEHKMAEAYTTVSCMDKEGFYRRYRIETEEALAPILEVPKFSSIEEAEAWLEEKDKPRQLYPEGVVVLWMREVPWPVSKSGIATPTGVVEYAGKVVSWTPTWRLAYQTVEQPTYQLLTAKWEEPDEVEMVWVPAAEIIGLAP